jgi:hypothetical protein
MHKHHLNPFSSYSPPIPELPQLRVMIDPISTHATRLAKGSAENAMRILLCGGVVISKFRPTLTRLQYNSSNTIGGRVDLFESSLIPMNMPC